MPPKSQWDDHINIVREFAEKNERFPTTQEAAELFSNNNLPTLDSSQRYQTIKHMIIRRRGWLVDNPWYTGKNDTRGPQEKIYPTINEKREAAGLEKHKNPEPETEPDTITMRLNGIRRGNLSKMYDRLFKTAQANEFERFDVIVKLVRRG